MLRRSSIIALEAVAALIAGAAILFGVLLWRISGDEPLRVSFLTPYLQAALTPPDGRFTVAIDDTVITWAGWERTLDLRARGVQAIAEDGQAIASVPQVSIALSLRALLRGLVAPTAIEVFGPHLYLRRGTDGSFSVAGIEPPQGGAPVAEGGGVFTQVMTALEREPDPDSPIGYLRRASVVNGRVTLLDDRLGMNWEAPEASFSVRRGPNGLTGEASVAVDQLGRPARFAARFDYDRASETIGIGGSFAGLDVPALGLIESSLMVLQGADLRLQGNFTTRIGLDGRISTTRFDLSGGPGQVSIADQIETPIALQRLSLRGQLDAGGDRLVIESAVVDLGGPQLAAQVAVSGLASAGTPKTGAIRVSGHLSAGNIAVDTLGRYWPRDAARGARSWVLDNITTGIADAGEVDFALRIAGGDGNVAIGRLAGSFDASGATVHYKKPLPPITDAAGHAEFDEKEFRVEFKEGASGSLRVLGGRTVITGLDEDDQIINVEGTAAGPLAEVLELLDHPSLGYASRLGIAPENAGGTARADLSFRIPAEKDVAFEDVAMAVNGAATDVTLGGAFFGQDVASPELSVALDNAGMDVAGEVTLAGGPLDLQWRENFDSAAEFQRRFVLDGRTTAEQRAALVIDLRPRFDGPVSGRAVYTEIDDLNSRMDADLDLGETIIAMPELVWRKAAGEPGRARFSLDLVDGRVTALRNLVATAGTLEAEGDLRFAANGQDLAAISLPRLAYGRTRLTGVEVVFTPARPEIVIAGGELDAEPMLEEDEAAPAPGTDAEDDTSDPLLLSAPRLDRVRLGEGRELANVSLLLDHDGAHWQRIVAEGALGNGSPFSMRYEPDPGSGDIQLRASAEDAGEALRAFDVFDNVMGGRLTVTGRAAAADPRRALTGKAEISQFRLVKAPAMARLLTIATLTGFVDILTGEGLLFTRFTGDFVKTDGRLEVPLARAYGPSLGLTTTGHLDFDQDTVDLEGTIAPAYVVNSILGNIPVIGDILQGGKGEGVFAATYKATGSLEEPQISVNPLSALAPGFLRGLFDVFDGDGGPVTPRALPEPGKDK